MTIYKQFAAYKFTVTFSHTPLDSHKAAAFRSFFDSEAGEWVKRNCIDIELGHYKEPLTTDIHYTIVAKTTPELYTYWKLKYD